jgi:hypothetical protein
MTMSWLHCGLGPAPAALAQLAEECEVSRFGRIHGRLEILRHPAASHRGPVRKMTEDDVNDGRNLPAFGALQCVVKPIAHRVGLDQQLDVALAQGAHLLALAPGQAARRPVSRRVRNLGDHFRGPTPDCFRVAEPPMLHAQAQRRPVRKRGGHLDEGSIDGNHR